MKLITSLAIVALAMSAACDGDSDETPDAGADSDAAPDAPVQSTALDPICQESGGLFVDLFRKAFECNRFFTFLLGDVSDARLSSFCYASFQPFIDDGTVEVGDATAIADCRAYIDGTDCQLLDLDVGACDTALVGQLAKGSDCDTGEQCESGSYCEPALVGCGTCEATFANGAVCNDNDQCASSYCGVAGNCMNKGNVGTTCAGDDDCLGQLLCDEGGTDLCVAVAFAVDDVCDSQNFAACGFPLSGLFCAAATNLCVAEVDVGATCDSVDSRCHTLDFEWCNAGTCAAPIVAAEGTACGIGLNTEARRCDDGLRCSSPFDGGTCVAPQQEGETCVDTDGVDPDNECDFLLSCVQGRCAQSEHTGECPTP